MEGSEYPLGIQPTILSDNRNYGDSGLLVQPRFLTIREVAERLRVCRATVYRMVDDGRLPAVRVSSGTIRVSESLLPRS